MEAQITKEFFDKNSIQAEKDWKEKFPNDENEGYYFGLQDNDEFTNAEFTEEGLEVTLSNDLGWFMATIPIDEVKMLEYVVKKINKIKTVLEGIR